MSQYISIESDLEKFINSLQKGDILLYHSRTLLSWIIRKIDKSKYHHASIYDRGGYIYESTRYGVSRKKLKHSIKGKKVSSITCYRIKDIEHESKDQIIEKVKHSYYGKPYPFLQILLFVYVMSSQNIQNKIKIKSLFIKLVIFISADFLIKLLDPKNNKPICSELIFKVYNEYSIESNNKAFDIEVPLNHSSLFDDFFEEEEEETTSNYTTTSLCRTNNIDDSEILTLFENYLKEKQNNASSIKSKLTCSKALKRHTINIVKENKKYYKKKYPKMAYLFKKVNLNNFITPGDLARAINIEKKNMYKFNH